MRTTLPAAPALTQLVQSLAAPSLRVYGPGGPATALKECAATFTKQTGITVAVTAGPEPQWLV